MEVLPEQGSGGKKNPATEDSAATGGRDLLEVVGGAFGRISVWRIWPPRFAVHAINPLTRSAAARAKVLNQLLICLSPRNQIRPPNANTPKAMEPPRRDARGVLMPTHRGPGNAGQPFDDILRRLAGEVGCHGGQRDNDERAQGRLPQFIAPLPNAESQQRQSEHGAENRDVVDQQVQMCAVHIVFPAHSLQRSSCAVQCCLRLRSEGGVESRP